MVGNPVGWFEIYVQDISRAKTFYESVFEVKLSRLNSPIEIWGFPITKERNGASGALVKMDGVSSGGNSTLVYFNCTDCAITADRASRFGGQIHREKMSIGEYGFIALVVDTEENMVGLHSDYEQT